MKKNYEDYDGYVEKYYDQMTLSAIDLEDKLEDIQATLDGICEVLEKLVKERKERAEFRPVKIGADIGEEKEQMDVIAKIFGNSK